MQKDTKKQVLWMDYPFYDNDFFNIVNNRIVPYWLAVIAIQPS